MKFTTIVGSIALSAGLIYAANILTHPKPESTSVSVASSNAQGGAEWVKTLEDIQAQSPLNRLPKTASKNTVDTMIASATSNNITDTVARTLLINISSAKSQGLGNDIPTQDELIADASARIHKRTPKLVYTSADLTLTDNTPGTLKAYGNAFMQAAQKHAKASYGATIYAIATSTENADPKRLAPLPGIQAEYAALAKDLAYVPVPPTLAPLHLKIVNNFERMSEAFPDMIVLYSDPLRALSGLQLFDALNRETLSLFTNIAQELNQNGILFNKDEPGATWNSLVP